MFEDRINKQFDFLKEIDKEKNIIRQTYLADGNRKEDDAEHAWHMAVMVMLLSEYANEKIDVYHTMCMALIHDLIEIYAGDTYAYDTDGNKTKKERECKAADRLFNMLPEDQAAMMRNLWDEFEAMKTPESKFANSMDKIQPLMLNQASGGKTWVEHDVHNEQVYGRNKRTMEGSNKLWEFADENFIKPNIGKTLK